MFKPEVYLERTTKAETPSIYEDILNNNSVIKVNTRKRKMVLKNLIKNIKSYTLTEENVIAVSVMLVKDILFSDYDLIENLESFAEDLIIAYPITSLIHYLRKMYTSIKLPNGYKDKSEAEKFLKKSILTARKIIADLIDTIKKLYESKKKSIYKVTNEDYINYIIYSAMEEAWEKTYGRKD